MFRSVRLIASLALLILLGCGASPSAVEWRNVTLPVPDGWVVVEATDARLRLASASAEQEVPPEGLVVLTIAFDPRALPDDVRAQATARGATLESDSAIVVGDEVPARRFVLLDRAVIPATRELVVLVPSRGLVATGVVVPGSAVADPAARLLEDLDVLLAVLVEAVYGPPVLD